MQHSLHKFVAILVFRVLYYGTNMNIKTNMSYNIILLKFVVTFPEFYHQMFRVKFIADHKSHNSHFLFSL
jgi:hypothetical protein